MSQTVGVEVGNLIGADLEQELYRQMAVARQIDNEGVAMQRQGLVPGYAPMRGQEAAQVGSGAALDLARDFAFPTYRELGVAVAMGVDLVAYMATHLATWHGALYDPLASRFASVNAVVAGSVLHAVGWAKGEQLSGRSGVAVAYFGDGASSQGDVHEAMNFAGVYRLPIVFFCQNNGWAISVPTERQVAGGSVAARAAGYGIEGDRVDGNDIVAVYQATAAALERARAGGGPTVIEAMTYRAGPHATSDDPGRYRTLADEQAWVERDPLTLHARRLREQRFADDQFFEAVTREAIAAAEEVRAGIIALEQRPGTEMFDFVFEQPTEPLLQQKLAWQSQEF
jgi:2-oxoisovalerate dehydrogenase E1 component alpha subunit